MSHTISLIPPESGFGALPRLSSGFPGVASAVEMCFRGECAGAPSFRAPDRRRNGSIQRMQQQHPASQAALSTVVQNKHIRSLILKLSQQKWENPVLSYVVRSWFDGEQQTSQAGILR